MEWFRAVGLLTGCFTEMPVAIPARRELRLSKVHDWITRREFARCDSA